SILPHHMTLYVIMLLSHLSSSCFFFFTHPAPPEIYTLSLHDALPICQRVRLADFDADDTAGLDKEDAVGKRLEKNIRRLADGVRSEEHTSELQSPYDLVCRLLLEKKKKQYNKRYRH